MEKLIFHTDHLQSQFYYNPENLAMIDPVDFEKIGLTEIVKNK